MYVGYVVVAVLTAAANIWAAMADVRHTGSAVANATKVGVATSWLVPLGLLKAAGAVGLLIGIVVPVIGLAAATGLILFFVCAVFAHLRVDWYATLPFPGGFLVLALGALLLRIATL